MAKDKPKKPTLKDIQLVISNLIKEIEFIGRKLYALDNVFNLYLEWSKDKEKFGKFVQKQVEDAKNNFLSEKLDKSENEPGETK